MSGNFNVTKFTFKFCNVYPHISSMQQYFFNSHLLEARKYFDFSNVHVHATPKHLCICTSYLHTLQMALTWWDTEVIALKRHFLHLKSGQSVLKLAAPC